MLERFPGMPLLTYQIRRRLRLSDWPEKLRLSVDPPGGGAAGDEAYSVHVGSELVGRFTVRRGPDLVERNFFCLLPEESTLPSGAVIEGAFGVAGPHWVDRLRVTFETLTVACRSTLDLLMPLDWVLHRRRSNALKTRGARR